MLLYHLTDVESMKQILRDGLKPMSGDNSHLTEDYTPAIYLCDIHSIPYWHILCNKSIVLKVKITDEEQENCLFRDYGTWIECVLANLIPADRCSYMCDISSVDKDAMYNICRNHLRRLVKMIHDMYDIYKRGDMDELIDSEDIFSYKQLIILNRLDFSVIDENTYRLLNKDVDLLSSVDKLKQYSNVMYGDFIKDLYDFINYNFGRFRR